MNVSKFFLILLFVSVFNCSTGAWYYTVYAEYLYYMAKHTERVNQPNSIKFEIGIYGSKPMFEATRQMSQKKRLGQRLIYVEEVSTLSSASDFQILFVGKDKAGELSKVIDYCKKHQILLVSDITGSVSKGVDVEFVEDQMGNIKFKINMVACKNHGIKVSPVLENMAMK